MEDVGDGEGSPELVIEYGGEEVAVEVARMSDGDGWPRDKRIGFERALGRVVQSVREEAGRPVGTCSASTIRGNLVPRHGVVRGRKSLGTSYESATRGGQIQLVSDRKRVGRGVVVEYLPAGNYDSSLGREAGHRALGGGDGIEPDRGVRGGEG